MIFKQYSVKVTLPSKILHSKHFSTKQEVNCNRLALFLLVMFSASLNPVYRYMYCSLTLLIGSAKLCQCGLISVTLNNRRLHPLQFCTQQQFIMYNRIKSVQLNPQPYPLNYSYDGHNGNILWALFECTLATGRVYGDGFRRADIFIGSLNY